MAAESSDDGEDYRPQEKVQAFWRNLWASWQRPMASPSRNPMDVQTPPSVGPQGNRRPAHLPEGSDTVRSSMSYLTARSTTSCDEEAQTLGGIVSYCGVASVR